LTISRKIANYAFNAQCLLPLFGTCTCVDACRPTPFLSPGMLKGLCMAGFGKGGSGGGLLMEGGDPCRAAKRQGRSVCVARLKRALQAQGDWLPRLCRSFLLPLRATARKLGGGRSLDMQGLSTGRRYTRGSHNQECT
jgi:hypothetical protein